MIFTQTPLPGACIISIEPIADFRGFFSRTFCSEQFSHLGLPEEFVQSSISANTRAGTMRGLHFQASPHEEDRLVRCTNGAVFDVIVDLRPNSPTYRKWFGTELTALNHNALFVPKGFAHGFLTLVDSTEVLYMMSVPFVAGFDRGIRWNDPAIGVVWPMEPAVISERDASYALLSPVSGL